MLKSLTHTTKAQSAKSIKRQWVLVDAKGKILGRTATSISRQLQGKQTNTYAPYMDGGDYVVVINASHVVVTGKRAITKQYKSYSGYPGGLSEESFERLLKRRPAEVIRRAVSGMLPKNKLRDRRLARLFVYPEETHPYASRFASKTATKSKS